jgi:hypothetical protein
MLNKPRSEIMSETGMTTTTTTTNRAGVVSLILAALAGAFLCLAGVSIGPGITPLLDLPALLTSLGAVIAGVLGLRQPTRRWMAIVGLILGGLLFLGALCTAAAVPLAMTRP